MADRNRISDDEPLFAEADEHFRFNKELLRRLKSVREAVDMRLDGISVRTGYFFYLHMKLYRRATAPGHRQGRKIVDPAFWGQLGNLLWWKSMPRNRTGELRIDHPADLYVGPFGVWNKNIDVDGHSVVVAIPSAPPFVPHGTPKISQAISLAPLFRLHSYRWGSAIYKALRAADLPVSRRRFWVHHFLYLMRLGGFAARFSRLLERNSFKAVHFCRFADVNMQGMLLAARKHGVKAVEYQHGVLSATHPAVALMDHTGPATVPDVLMVAETIYANLGYGATEVKMQEARAGQAIITNTTKRSRGLLLAMQPRFATDAVNLALHLAEDFPELPFTLRSHPRAGVAADRLLEISQLPNLRYERAEEVESTLSLADSAGVIAGSSTMGLSAAVRGLPSLFVHQEGYEQATQLLAAQRHLIATAGTYAAIRAWVRSVQVP